MPLCQDHRVGKIPGSFKFRCVQQSWTTLAGASPVTVIASELTTLAGASPVTVIASELCS